MTQSLQLVPKWHLWLATLLVAITMLFLGSGHAYAQTPKPQPAATATTNCPTTQATVTPAAKPGHMSTQRSRHYKHKHHRHGARRHHRHQHHNALAAKVAQLQAEVACKDQQIAALNALIDDPTIGYKAKTAKVDSLQQQLATTQSQKAALQARFDGVHSWMWGWAIASGVLAALLIGVIVVAILYILGLHKDLDAADRQNAAREHEANLQRQRENFMPPSPGPLPPDHDET